MAAGGGFDGYFLNGWWWFWWLLGKFETNSMLTTEHYIIYVYILKDGMKYCAKRTKEMKITEAIKFPSPMYNFSQSTYIKLIKIVVVMQFCEIAFPRSPEPEFMIVRFNFLLAFWTLIPDCYLPNFLNKKLTSASLKKVKEFVCCKVSKNFYRSWQKVCSKLSKERYFLLTLMLLHRSPCIF